MPPENHSLPSEDTHGHSSPKLAASEGTFGLAPTQPANEFAPEGLSATKPASAGSPPTEMGGWQDGEQGVHEGGLGGGTPQGAVSPVRGQATASLLSMLREMFEEVRAYLLGKGRQHQERVGTNAKGDITRAFDAQAEQIALAYARDHLSPVRVLSEESGEQRFGRAAPRYTLVIDPCDGSNNFKRGVRVVGFAVAVLAGDAPALDPALVKAAFVGDIFTGSSYTASRGGGAYLDGRPIRGSALTELRRAMLSINIGRVQAPSNPADENDPRRTNLPATVWRLMSQVSTVRRLGATTLDLCYVAQGAFEGYIDLRCRLTPENFLAPALIIEEAGGFFGNEHGEPLGPVEFTTGYPVLAAGNQDLARQLARVLSK